ncbi:MAG: pyruvate:ferredoxin (flavodoxin) oxidoreductase [Polyangiales bacterium]
MASARTVTLDANEAVASVAHRLSEVIAIYPITPASAMGEHADEWSAAGRVNVWGEVPRVVEMQSEGGAAGAVHGALQVGALTTTFTASQGLLLMIPDLYKIAGELTAFCLHVAARSVATHALSIFGDHSDVMLARGAGLALLASGSVQEAQDLAAIAHASTHRARVPFLHFFDGFRTSHEVASVAPLDDDDLRALLDADALAAHRARALDPDRPVLRGTAQNPDVFFQAREACNPYYDAAPGIVRDVMERFAARTGRRYRLFEYDGHPEAERVVVLMGSGGETAVEAVERLVAAGERVGVVRVRLYRPFDVRAFVSALPATVRALSVLDRTKEPGAPAEPLHLDVCAAVDEAEREGFAPWSSRPVVVGGRYGLSSKEFTPSMVKAALDDLAKPRPRSGFTLGIVDDVTHRSISNDPSWDAESDDVVRAVFYGLGSDGTVSANKNTLKILGEETELRVQGYFVYDSKKAGAVTVSHLRFSPRPIRSAWLVRAASFVACHQPGLVEKMDVLALAAPGATFLLNAPWAPDEAWGMLPREVQSVIVERGLKVFVVDAQRVAGDAGLGKHISTVMQACFFALSGVLPRDAAVTRMREAITRTFSRRGAEVVRRNLEAVGNALAHLHPVPVPTAVTGGRPRPPPVSSKAPDFVQRVTAVMMSGLGDSLPVSAFPVDGTWPVGTARWEKRSLARSLPVWDPSICIQCNKCSLVCPHAAIRTVVYAPEEAAREPEGMPSLAWKGAGFEGHRYAVQVAPDDCTGCGLCAVACPAKDKKNPRHKSLDMSDDASGKALERPRWDFVTSLPEVPRARVHLDVKGSQLVTPLFEFSGACSGCGETPYLKLMTQMFGDRALVANATGCSSIYGANLPTTPWGRDADGRGPAWSNSLFEDNAEFGLGMRLAADARRLRAEGLVRGLSAELGDALVTALVEDRARDDVGVAAQRERVRLLRERLRGNDSDAAKALVTEADWLVRRSVWIVGGDGWAYDIGYGGLDHVIASGEDVNLLVLDTEVYSNTGGQQSKATPLGAAAKFASAGKEVPKKDLGLLAMSYGSVYVARVAFGARDAQTVKAFAEAEAYPGPSLILAYSHCIAHGYDLAHGIEQQRLAVESGVWPLFRFDPERAAQGEAPLHLDGPPPKVRVSDYLRNEGRFRMVELADPERYRRLVARAEREAVTRRSVYEQLATLKVTPKEGA